MDLDRPGGHAADPRSVEDELHFVGATEVEPDSELPAQRKRSQREPGALEASRGIGRGDDYRGSSSGYRSRAGLPNELREGVAGTEGSPAVSQRTAPSDPEREEQGQERQCDREFGQTGAPAGTAARQPKSKGGCE